MFTKTKFISVTNDVPGNVLKRFFSFISIIFIQHFLNNTLLPLEKKKVYTPTPHEKNSS